MTLFSNGSETANLVVSSGLLQQLWAANSNLLENGDPNESLRCKIYPQQNYNILAFATSPWTLDGDEADLFCQVPKNIPLIITGHSLGGSIASLFTLWMLDNMDLSKTKRPLCITFGSPLVGDSSLQKAIFQSQTWNSCFLHVVSNQDPVPRIFLHHNPVHQTGAYKPFGTFLICSESGCACFGHPDSILELLPASASYGVQNRYPHEALVINHYQEMVEKLNGRTICRNATEPVDWDRGVLRDNLAEKPFDTGIYKQIKAILTGPPKKKIDIQTLIKQEKDIIAKKKASDLSTELNDMKINMVQLEWYKKFCKDEKTGYYDTYKNKKYEWDINVQEFKKKLTNYWIDKVKEAESKPQKEGASLRTRWLGAGTNYRRMVEPLDIAEYYKENKLNYETQGRSRHYIRLEEWLKEENNSESNQNNSKKENVASILTIDSCFWAKVEEAIVLCNLLKTENFGVEQKKNKLKEFEKYLWGLLKNYQVSSEIFLRGSSFMKWWEDYKKTMEGSSTSQLHHFMNSRAYEEYAKGTWSPPIYDLIF
nr:senescence-associated carboxylesterase 101-like [Ziziphus jujuba var. spinosa]